MAGLNNSEQVKITQWFVIETPSVNLTGDNYGNVRLEPYRGLGTMMNISDLELAIEAYYEVWRPDDPELFVKVGGTL